MRNYFEMPPGESDGGLQQLGLRLVWLLLATLVLFLFVLKRMAPPFLTYDSYHYLHLSLRPEVADSHPLFFGMLMKGLAAIAHLFNDSWFLYLFYLLQCFSAVVLISPLVWTGFDKREDVFRSRIKLFWVGSYLLVSALLVAPGILYLINAFWTEMVSFLLLFLVGFLLQSIGRHKKWRFIKILLCAMVGTLAYHTRYQMMIIPFCVLGLGLVLFLKSDRKAAALRDNYIWAVVAAAMLFGILTSDFLLRKELPKNEAQSGITVLGTSVSIQCALRCGVKLYSVDCSTTQGKALIEGSRCSEFLFGLKSLGTPLVPLNGKITDLFRTIGWKATLHWILAAPLSYLTDIHDLEMGLFQFGADSASQAYPEVGEYYGPYFQSKWGGNPKGGFLRMVRYLDKLFKKFRAFHWLTVAVVLIGLMMLIVRQKNVLGIFLTLYSIACYFIFAYVNPEVPFRYLMQIIVPGWIGLMLCYLELKPRQKRNRVLNSLSPIASTLN